METPEAHAHAARPARSDDESESDLRALIARSTLPTPSTEALLELEAPASVRDAIRRSEAIFGPLPIPEPPRPPRPGKLNSIGPSVLGLAILAAVIALAQAPHHKAKDARAASTPGFTSDPPLTTDDALALPPIAAQTESAPPTATPQPTTPRATAPRATAPGAAPTQAAHPAPARAPLAAQPPHPVATATPSATAPAQPPSLMQAITDAVQRPNARH
jgi:hypothetical protein